MKNQEPPSKDQILWESIKRKRGFIQAPKGLWSILPFDQWGFLVFLIDWMFFRVDPTALENNGGWFYCPAKTIERIVPGTTASIQKRIFRQLSEKGFVKTKMLYGSKKHEGKRRYDNHRMIKINLIVLLELVRQKVESKETRYLRSLPYSEYLKTEHWQNVRCKALKAAKHRCQLCYGNRSLDVHHRTYDRLGEERISDTTVLCRLCHAKHHNKPE